MLIERCRYPGALNPRGSRKGEIRKVTHLSGSVAHLAWARR
jgi:hypothetical protein